MKLFHIATPACFIIYASEILTISGGSNNNNNNNNNDVIYIYAVGPDIRRRCSGDTCDSKMSISFQAQ